MTSFQTTLISPKVLSRIEPGLITRNPQAIAYLRLHQCHYGAFLAGVFSDRVLITQILSGKGMRDRLGKMGLTLGSEVRVISKTTSGSVIICIQDRQIGLGARMAHKVMVTLAAGKS